MATQSESRVGWCRHLAETAATLDPAAAASGVRIDIAVLWCHSVVVSQSYSVTVSLFYSVSVSQGNMMLYLVDLIETLNIFISAVFPLTFIINLYS